ncbi:MAG: hypothetical protein HY537_06310 [Deltaproteobacteria bacterium]|nr:hypothetical protein [Deltaproteobacteria bacterium]
MRPRLSPSTYYPDYFKSDLGIGSELAHPIATALDNAFTEMLCLGECFAHSLQPLYWPEPKQREFLTLLGFRTENLDVDKCERLFEKHQQLWENKDRLEAIEQLASIYFGPTRIQRGRFFARSTVEGQTPFPLHLSDQQGCDRTVVVRLEQKHTSTVIEEFRSNAKLLMPDGFEIWVAPTVSVPEQLDNRINLGHPFALKQRRL